MFATSPADKDVIVDVLPALNAQVFVRQRGDRWTPCLAQEPTAASDRELMRYGAVDKYPY